MTCKLGGSNKHGGAVGGKQSEARSQKSTCSLYLVDVYSISILLSYLNWWFISYLSSPGHVVDKCVMPPRFFWAPVLITGGTVLATNPSRTPTVFHSRIHEKSHGVPLLVPLHGTNGLGYLF